MSEGVRVRIQTDESDAHADPSESAVGPTAVMPALGLETTASVSATSGAEVSNDDDNAAAKRPILPSTDDDDELHEAPIADPLIGVVVADRYRILEPLGRGGMGIVYKVEHTRIGKLLAMKLLTGELSRNRDVVRRFKQEALTVSKLSSPNTVQVFDFGAAEGLTYLVMELVAGEDLGRTLRMQGAMPFSRLGKIIIQVCSSLAEAHQKGIVHRDIKPENVMLVRTRDGGELAKVLDFGLAKLREGEGLNDVTSQGAIVGTPYFMAPEQILGEAVDARTDIYSLGALMYRALTGHHPFNGPTPMAVFSKHLSAEPVPPSSRAPEQQIPPGVNDLLLSMLSKDPAKRPQKVEDVQAALVEELRPLGTSSIDDLLNSAQMRDLTKAADKSATQTNEIATRDELEAYERKLRRQRWGALVSAFMFVAIAAAVGGRYFLLYSRAFKEVEVEPNDAAGEATNVPFGSIVRGMLGKRLDPSHGDRDFYAIDVPAQSSEAQTRVKLEVSALPNIPMCTLLYKQGLSTPFAQYCVGRAGRNLEIPALRLDPGRYFVTVIQDMDAYGRDGPVYVHENISDWYVVRMEPTTASPAYEVEPNDQAAAANVITPGASMKATIGWTSDEDVFCVDAEAKEKIRFRVNDSLRESGVLEVTPLSSAGEGAPVRLHAGGNKFSATDAKLPWQSELIAREPDPTRCLRVRLVADPWSSHEAGIVPSGGSEEYVVEVQAVP